MLPRIRLSGGAATAVKHFFPIDLLLAALHAERCRRLRRSSFLRGIFIEGKLGKKHAG